ncbi:unnamed protein product [Amoebophrya sp. A120]|nr:unnamed protein product [Amoebophrya sp. A120]|eukprot:GSA120T00001790001.1
MRELALTMWKTSSCSGTTMKAGPIAGSYLQRLALCAVATALWLSPAVVSGQEAGQETEVGQFYLQPNYNPATFAADSNRVVWLANDEEDNAQDGVSRRELAAIGSDVAAGLPTAVTYPVTTKQYTSIQDAVLTARENKTCNVNVTEISGTLYPQLVRTAATTATTENDRIVTSLTQDVMKKAVLDAILALNLTTSDPTVFDHIDRFSNWTVTVQALAPTGPVLSKYYHTLKLTIEYTLRLAFPSVIVDSSGNFRGNANSQADSVMAEQLALALYDDAGSTHSEFKAAFRTSFDAQLATLFTPASGETVQLDTAFDNLIAPNVTETALPECSFELKCGFPYDMYDVEVQFSFQRYHELLPAENPHDMLISEAEAEAMHAQLATPAILGNAVLDILRDNGIATETLLHERVSGSAVSPMTTPFPAVNTQTVLFDTFTLLQNYGNVLRMDDTHVNYTLVNFTETVNLTDANGVQLVHENTTEVIITRMDMHRRIGFQVSLPSTATVARVAAVLDKTGRVVTIEEPTGVNTKSDPALFQAMNASTAMNNGLSMVDSQLILRKSYLEPSPVNPVRYSFQPYSCIRLNATDTLLAAAAAARANYYVNATANDTYSAFYSDLTLTVEGLGSTTAAELNADMGLIERTRVAIAAGIGSADITALDVQGVVYSFPAPLVASSRRLLSSSDDISIAPRRLQASSATVKVSFAILLADTTAASTRATLAKRVDVSGSEAGTMASTFKTSLTTQLAQAAAVGLTLALGSATIKSATVSATLVEVSGNFDVLLAQAAAGSDPALTGCRTYQTFSAKMTVEMLRVGTNAGNATLNSADLLSLAATSFPAGIVRGFTAGTTGDEVYEGVIAPTVTSLDVTILQKPAFSLATATAAVNVRQLAGNYPSPTGLPTTSPSMMMQPLTLLVDYTITLDYTTANRDKMLDDLANTFGHQYPLLPGFTPEDEPSFPDCAVTGRFPKTFTYLQIDATQHGYFSDCSGRPCTNTYSFPEADVGKCSQVCSVEALCVGWDHGVERGTARCYLHSVRSETLVTGSTRFHPYILPTNSVPLSTFKTASKVCMLGALASSVCPVPARFCAANRENYEYHDCDGDGVRDHVCTESDGRTLSFVPSANSCKPYATADQNSVCREKTDFLPTNGNAACQYGAAVGHHCSDIAARALKYHTNVVTVEACHDLCQAEPACKGFYRYAGTEDPNRCTLMKEACGSTSAGGAMQWYSIPYGVNSLDCQFYNATDVPGQEAIDANNNATASKSRFEDAFEQQVLLGLSSFGDSTLLLREGRATAGSLRDHGATDTCEFTYNFVILELEMKWLTHVTVSEADMNTYMKTHVQTAFLDGFTEVNATHLHSFELEFLLTSANNVTTPVNTSLGPDNETYYEMVDTFAFSEAFVERKVAGKMVLKFRATGVPEDTSAYAQAQATFATTAAEQNYFALVLNSTSFPSAAYIAALTGLPGTKFTDAEMMTTPLLRTKGPVLYGPNTVSEYTKNVEVFTCTDETLAYNASVNFLFLLDGQRHAPSESQLVDASFRFDEQIENALLLPATGEFVAYSFYDLKSTQTFLSDGVTLTYQELDYAGQTSASHLALPFRRRLGRDDDGALLHTTSGMKNAEDAATLQELVAPIVEAAEDRNLLLADAEERRRSLAAAGSVFSYVYFKTNFSLSLDRGLDTVEMLQMFLSGNLTKMMSNSTGSSSEPLQQEFEASLVNWWAQNVITNYTTASDKQLPTGEFLSRMSLVSASVAGNATGPLATPGQCLIRTAATTTSTTTTTTTIITVPVAGTDIISASVPMTLQIPASMTAAMALQDPTLKEQIIKSMAASLGGLSESAIQNLQLTAVRRRAEEERQVVDESSSNRRSLQTTTSNLAVTVSFSAVVPVAQATSTQSLLTTPTFASSLQSNMQTNLASTSYGVASVSPATSVASVTFTTTAAPPAPAPTPPVTAAPTPTPSPTPVGTVAPSPTPVVVTQPSVPVQPTLPTPAPTPSPSPTPTPTTATGTATPSSFHDENDDPDSVVGIVLVVLLACGCILGGAAYYVYHHINDAEKRTPIGRNAPAADSYHRQKIEQRKEKQEKVKEERLQAHFDAHENMIEQAKARSSAGSVKALGDVELSTLAVVTDGDAVSGKRKSEKRRSSASRRSSTRSSKLSESSFLRSGPGGRRSTFVEQDGAPGCAVYSTRESVTAEPVRASVVEVVDDLQPDVLADVLASNRGSMDSDEV